MPPTRPGVGIADGRGLAEVVIAACSEGRQMQSPSNVLDCHARDLSFNSYIKAEYANHASLIHQQSFRGDLVVFREQFVGNQCFLRTSCLRVLSSHSQSPKVSKTTVSTNLL